MRLCGLSGPLPYSLTIPGPSALRLASAATFQHLAKGHPFREAVQRRLGYYALPTAVVSLYVNANSHRKALGPEAPLGLSRVCDARGGVACVPCNTAGTCTTSVRATRKKSPTRVISWSPVLGKPSTISTMVGNPCCDRGVTNPSVEAPATTLPPGSASPLAVPNMPVLASSPGLPARRNIAGYRHNHLYLITAFSSGRHLWHAP